MTHAFTVCSANYLPFAKAMADSLLAHNPSHQFSIFLTDQAPDFDPAPLLPHAVYNVQELGFEDLESMQALYDMFELSCALKPFAAEHLLQTQPACSKVFYFDSDILVYDALSEAEDALDKHPMVLTPHVFTVGTAPASAELGILRTGLYNAGFFGVAKGKDGLSFLAWWKERLKEHCFNNALGGLFVDQIWLDFVPIYFRNTCILFHPGYNLAYWNFAERRLSEHNGQYRINEESPLVFFHYSGHDVNRPEVISKHSPDVLLYSQPAFKPLFTHYQQRVEENRHLAPPPPAVVEPPPVQKPWWRKVFT